MRISDWSSDVCSSDLAPAFVEASSTSIIANRQSLSLNIHLRVSIADSFSFSFKGLGESLMGLSPLRIRWALSTIELFTPCCRCTRTEEHTSELQSLMRSPYAVIRFKKNTIHTCYNLT